MQPGQRIYCSKSEKLSRSRTIPSMTCGGRSDFRTTVRRHRTVVPAFGQLPPASGQPSRASADCPPPSDNRPALSDGWPRHRAVVPRLRTAVPRSGQPSPVSGQLPENEFRLFRIKSGAPPMEFRGRKCGIWRGRVEFGEGSASFKTPRGGPTRREIGREQIGIEREPSRTE